MQTPPSRLAAAIDAALGEDVALRDFLLTAEDYGATYTRTAERIKEATGVEVHAQAIRRWTAHYQKAGEAA